MFSKLKLSKVATAFDALMNSIAFPTVETVPPPVAAMVGEAPLSVNAGLEICELVTFNGPDAVTALENAATPTEFAPETLIVVGP